MSAGDRERVRDAEHRHTRVSSDRPQRVTHSKKSKHETVCISSERPLSVLGTYPEHAGSVLRSPLRDLRGTTEGARLIERRAPSPTLPKASRCAITYGLGVYPCPTAPRRENWGSAHVVCDEAGSKLSRKMGWARPGCSGSRYHMRHAR